MKGRIKRITIICEGYEEFDYLLRLLHLGLWNEKYTVRIKNAKSLTNIPPVYQSEFQNDTADLVVCSAIPSFTHTSSSKPSATR